MRPTAGPFIPEMPNVLHIALVEPQIAPNTGNIARLCVATGTRLHLVGPLGFRLDDRYLRRAGVDCWEHLDWQQHADWCTFRTALGAARLIAFSAHAQQSYTTVSYVEGDCLVFGNESAGLPQSILADPSLHAAVTIPMPTGKLRSINLATATGIALYEALRQLRNW
jgi:tRNA (cytidine/uridine-2'-O-)-methyltransferase